MNNQYRITRYVGVELEVSESADTGAMPPRCEYWLKKDDGSINGHGAEFVFDKPLIGNDVVQAINNICFWFKHRSTYSPGKYTAKDFPRNTFEEYMIGRDFYFRTENVNNGFHLHIDFRGKTDEDVLRFCDVGHMIYPYIYRTVNENRRNSTYCDEYDRLPSTLAADIGSRNISRYKWISPNPFFTTYNKDTVEIRLHEGTGDKDKILTWIEFWATLANLCDNKRVTTKLLRDNGGFPWLITRMNLSHKTKERFSKCVW